MQNEASQRVLEKKGRPLMISRELARKLIEQITQYTEYNVNIMDADGTIIASRDPGRVGQFHEVAHRILQGQESIVVTTDRRDSRCSSENEL